MSETVKVKVDTATKAALEKRAASDCRSVGAVVRMAIRDYLAKGKR